MAGWAQRVGVRQLRGILLISSGHCGNYLVAFSALTLLVGRQERHPACKKMRGMVEVGTA